MVLDIINSWLYEWIKTQNLKNIRNISGFRKQLRKRQCYQMMSQHLAKGICSSVEALNACAAFNQVGASPINNI